MKIDRFFDILARDVDMSAFLEKLVPVFVRKCDKIKVWIIFKNP